jgi:hypothetical protein
MSPDPKSEGDTTPDNVTFTFPDPPEPFGRLGRVMFNLGTYSYDTAAVSSGPNQGLYYVTSYAPTGTRYFQWAMTNHLANASSEFFERNCGSPPFISGAVLRSNVQEHEAGTSLGHYQQYRDARNAHNPGAAAEQHVLLAESETAFRSHLVQTLTAKFQQIFDATSSESACNSEANYDTSCTRRGEINYPPYQPCGGGSSSGMQSDSAVRGCSGWWWWNPVYQPNAEACLDYCSQNNADACEWFVNGDCYVEFGSGCYVQPGFPGWSAAVLSGSPQAGGASARPHRLRLAASRDANAGQ